MGATAGVLWARALEVCCRHFGEALPQKQAEFDAIVSQFLDAAEYVREQEVGSTVFHRACAVGTTEPAASRRHLPQRVSSVSHSIAEYSSLTMPLYTLTHSHAHTLTITCCYDVIDGTQDLKICSHADSQILSHSICVADAV